MSNSIARENVHLRNGRNKCTELKVRILFNMIQTFIFSRLNKNLIKQSN